MNWEKGRQDSNYFKKLLWRTKFPVGHDVLLLKYPSGSHIDWHKDPVEQGKHFRMNMVLNWGYEGGEFESEDEVLFSFGPITFFRPDKNEHRVKEIKEGTRYVFSFGFVL